LDPLIRSQRASLRNALQDKDLRVSAESPSAPFQRAGQDALPSAEMPPDLAQIAAAWQRLPDVVTAGILAMVSAAAASGVATGKGAKAEMVLSAIRAQRGEFRLADIEQACSGVGREWIRILLANLKREGKAVCHGKGPAARWRYSDK
jgi:hypothetical protein